MIYWSSTKSPMNLFKQSYQTAELDKFLKETVGVDPSILAYEVHMNRQQIKAYQRKLGLRKLTGNGRNGNDL